VTEPSGRPLIVVNGRVQELPPYRSSVLSLGEHRSDGWVAVAILGVLSMALGGLVAEDQGSAAAVGGVVWFLGTAVLAETERPELATALGVSGVVWTAVGISVYLGVDPSRAGTFVALVLLGAVAVLAGAVGLVRTRSPRPRTGDPVQI
jgi:peptidoglycan/LPS O-acetylase OafA/YrhL